MLFPATIAELAPHVATRELSARALTNACLEQIERLEPRLRAWVAVDAAGALAAADELDRQLAAGEYRGPLHGVPLGIKDIIDVAGLPTRCGSTLTSSEPAAADAPLVARLRAAGAVILGKTVTTEFACFDPPPTVNPWNAAHTPGGSSSGSAVAVATGMCLGAVGSQTGGSVTRPAAYCGVASCKPTFGRIPREAMFPVSEHLDQAGVFARSVADLGLLLTALQEEFCPAVELPPAESLRPPRLLVCEEFFFERATADVVEATRTCLEQLRIAGAEIIAGRLPASFADVHVQHRRIMAAEAAAVHREWFATSPEQYGKNIAGLLREGLAIPPETLQAALTHLVGFAQEMGALLADGLILVTPATSSVAPATDTTGDPLFISPWTYAGLPTVSLPMGLGRESLPLAIQLIGSAWRETELFHAAAWCERQIDFHHTPPGIEF